jgi:hypothetical protein
VRLDVPSGETPVETPAGRRTRLNAPRRHGSLCGRCRSRRALAFARGRAARRAVASAASAGRASQRHSVARRRQSCRLARALARAAAPASARHAARAPTNGALARPRDTQETRTRPDWLFALTWLIRARDASRARTRAAAAVAAAMRAPVRPALAASRRQDAASQAALLLRPALQRRLRQRTRGSSRCARRSATWHTPVRPLRCTGEVGVSWHQAALCFIGLTGPRFAVTRREEQLRALQTQLRAVQAAAVVPQARGAAIQRMKAQR